MDRPIQPFCSDNTNAIGSLVPPQRGRHVAWAALCWPHVGTGDGAIAFLEEVGHPACVLNPTSATSFGCAVRVAEDAGERDARLATPSRKNVEAGRPCTKT